MLRVLALDPENAEAAKVLRDIDRQKLTRIQANQAQRAARASQANAAVAARAAPGPAAAADGSESYDIEVTGEVGHARNLGTDAGDELLARAGSDFLAKLT
jgi:hypothetical protein